MLVFPNYASTIDKAYSNRQRAEKRKGDNEGRDGQIPKEHQNLIWASHSKIIKRKVCRFFSPPGWRGLKKFSFQQVSSPVAFYVLKIQNIWISDFLMRKGFSYAKRDSYLCFLAVWQLKHWEIISCDCTVIYERKVIAWRAKLSSVIFIDFRDLVGAPPNSWLLSFAGFDFNILWRKWKPRIVPFDARD